MRGLILAISLLLAITASARDRQNFDEGWRFALGDSTQMSATTYDDS